MMYARLIASVLFAAGTAAARSPPDAPKLVASSPWPDAVVAAGEQVLQLTFDRPMRRTSWSVTGDPVRAPNFVGTPAFSADGRTFSQKMLLEPGRSYEIGVNSPSHRNFRDTAGAAAALKRVRFSTLPRR